MSNVYTNVHSTDVLFLVSGLQLAGGIRAMDDESGPGLRGFRFKWKRQSHDSSVLSSLHDNFAEEVQHVSDVNLFRAGDTDEPGSAHQIAQDPGSGNSPDLGLAFEDVADRSSLQYEPSVAVSENDWTAQADVGGRSSKMDDHAAVTDVFIRGARFTSLVMPWETPLMRQIFSDSPQVPSLSMPSRSLQLEGHQSLWCHQRKFGRYQHLCDTRLMRRILSRGTRPCIMQSANGIFLFWLTQLTRKWAGSLKRRQSNRSIWSCPQ